MPARKSKGSIGTEYRIGWRKDYQAKTQWLNETEADKNGYILTKEEKRALEELGDDPINVAMKMFEDLGRRAYARVLNQYLTEDEFVLVNEWGTATKQSRLVAKMKPEDVVQANMNKRWRNQPGQQLEFWWIYTGMI